MNFTTNQFFYPTTGADANMTKTILYEFQCELTQSCLWGLGNGATFKAYLARWLADTTLMAPFTAPIIEPLLKSSAKAAASTCTAGMNQTSCRVAWWNGTAGDSSIGAPQQITALETITANLLRFRENNALLTSSTGGSQGNPNALGGVPLAPGEFSGMKKLFIGVIVGLTMLTIILLGGGLWCIFRR